MAGNKPHLRFRDHGVAYAHLSLPVGRNEIEAEAIDAALRAENLKPKPDGWKISFMTGQSDVMLDLQVRDFRTAVHLQYSSESMGANWLFLVPYHPVVPIADRKTREKKPADELQLHFVIHTRLERSAYRSGAIDLEREVVELLQHQLTRKGISGQVLAGFGWSDLVVGGTFSDMEVLRQLIFAIETKAIGGQRVAQRILTLVGYDWKLDPDQRSLMTVSPLLLARARPTHLRQAVDALTLALPKGKNWASYTVDGKWDLVFSADKLQIPITDYLDMHRRVAVKGTDLSGKGVERMESHLLARKIVRKSEDGPPDPIECNCRRMLDTEPPIVADEDAIDLPKALRRAITNVFDLFRAASRDTTNCCDVIPSLLRCAAAGRRLIANYGRLQQAVQHYAAQPGQTREVVKWSHVLAQARVALEEWCTYAERSVSQRTVGRFEEFLAQNDRVVSYRGGIQKMLYIADCLTNSYSQTVFGVENEIPFIVLYDPVDTVVNMRNAGFIRVPVRYLFFLPLAITHLWHEVGVQAFFQEYPVPFDEKMQERIEDFSQITTSFGPSEVVRVHVEVAEMYADFITLHYGFREKVEDFTLALASATFEQVSFRLTPEVGKKTYLVYLLTRLYLVSEFQIRRHLIEALRKRSPNEDVRDTLAAWRPNDQVIHTTIRHIADDLTTRLLAHRRYQDEPQITPHLVDLAAENVGHGIDAVHRPYMNDLALKLRPVPEESARMTEAFSDILNGEVISLEGLNPNALYQRLQHRMIETLRNKKRGEESQETFLKLTAALMRSVLLEFYQQ